jgi:soluble lytic murein transglycosylase-like protein
MQNLTGAFPSPDDAVRRRRNTKQLASILVLGAGVLLISGNRQAPAPADPGAMAAAGFAVPAAPMSENARLSQKLDSARAEATLLSARLERAQLVIGFSGRYGVRADLAALIYDASKGEGIDPDLAFRLVKLESEFNPKAISTAGAIGLTQLMPATARFFQKGVRAEQLYEPALNVRIGLRYIRTLMDEYKGNVNMALLVYNRGEVAVRDATSLGLDPTNGYDRIVMKGYKGKGID